MCGSSSASRNFSVSCPRHPSPQRQHACAVPAEREGSGFRWEADAPSCTHTLHPHAVQLHPALSLHPLPPPHSSVSTLQPAQQPPTQCRRWVPPCRPALSLSLSLSLSLPLPRLGGLCFGTPPAAATQLHSPTQPSLRLSHSLSRERLAQRLSPLQRVLHRMPRGRRWRQWVSGTRDGGETPLQTSVRLGINSGGAGAQRARKIARKHRTRTAGGGQRACTAGS